MAGLPRVCRPGIPLHVIQRCNSRQVCFGFDDFAADAHWLEEYAKKWAVAVHAWVFMTNHVHLLLTPATGNGVSERMQALGRRYVRYFNYTSRRSGTLWEGRFKSCMVDAEEYLLLCQSYIERNPVRAGMVDGPGDYYWSSYRANGLGKPAGLWTPHPVYLSRGRASSARATVYRRLFRGQIEEAVLTGIRKATHQGIALRNERFVEAVGNLSGRRLVSLKRGSKGQSRRGVVFHLIPNGRAGELLSE